MNLDSLSSTSHCNEYKVEKDSVIFLHEKIKDFNSLILNSSSGKNKKSNLCEIKDVLDHVITKNEEVKNKLDFLINELEKQNPE